MGPVRILDPSQTRPDKQYPNREGQGFGGSGRFTGQPGPLDTTKHKWIIAVISSSDNSKLWQMEQNNPYIDPKSGFNSVTKTFHSLRPPVDFPPEDAPLSAVEYAFSVKATLPWRDDWVALINPVTGQSISFADFIRRAQSLASYLQNVTKLSKNDTAFVLSPNSIHVPILYFSLFSLGVIISPANPVSTESEVSHQIQLCKPVIAFATSLTVHKLPKLKHQIIIIDSPEFGFMMKSLKQELQHVRVSQSDVAAIMYSSGTTGKVKGVILTHRNLIAVVAGSVASWKKRESPGVMLYTMPYFHIFGFFYCLRSVALSETAVVMERFDLKKMLRAVQEFRVTHVALTPPVVVVLSKSVVTDGYDLSSLEGVVCGGAPLGKDVIAAFTVGFPKVALVQIKYQQTTGKKLACSGAIVDDEGLRFD